MNRAGRLSPLSYHREEDKSSQKPFPLIHIANSNQIEIQVGRRSVFSDPFPAKELQRNFIVQELDSYDKNHQNLEGRLAPNRWRPSCSAASSGGLKNVSSVLSQNDSEFYSCFLSLFFFFRFLHPSAASLEISNACRKSYSLVKTPLIGAWQRGSALKNTSNTRGGSGGGLNGWWSAIALRPGINISPLRICLSRARTPTRNTLVRAKKEPRRCQRYKEIIH